MSKAILLACLVFILSLASHAQICSGSSLIYFVRDAKGKLISADSEGLTFSQPAGSRRGGFIVTEVKPERSWWLDQFTLTPEEKKFAQAAKFFSAGDMCGFHGPLTMSITMGKKVMELTFDLKDMGGATASGEFVVDSKPFTAGKYKIDLTGPGRSDHGESYYGGAYPASGWKKIP